MGVDHPRLNPGESVPGVKLEQVGHPCRTDHDRVTIRQRAPGESRSRTSRDYGHCFLRKDAQHTADFVGVPREHDRSWRPSVGGQPVGFISQKTIRVDDDPSVSHDTSEAIPQLLRQRLWQYVLHPGPRRVIAPSAT